MRGPVLAFVLAAAPLAASAVEVQPLYVFQVLGGQLFFKNQRGSLTGNALGLVAPALRFGDRFTLLPSLSAEYKGTQQALQLANAGTLFHEQWDNRAGLKAIFSPGGPDGPWRVKPGGGISYQFLKETKDERWLRGLFDYYRWTSGVEVEYVYHDPHSVRMGADYFETRFPRYTSLESELALGQPSQALARELVGNRVLDTRGAAATLAGDGPISDRVFIEGGASALYQDFYNQFVVDDAGQLRMETREDVTTTLSVGLRFPAQVNPEIRFLSAVDFGVGYNTSNQNSFDAQRVQFMPFYYNYGQVQGGPTFKILIGPDTSPIAIGASATWWYRRYPYRPHQNESGTYLNESVKTNSYAGSLNLDYPMAKHLSLIIGFQYGGQESNQKFEQFYSYNYTVKNYLFGFRYEY